MRAWRRYIDEFFRVGEAILGDKSLPVTDRLAKVFESLTRLVLANAALHRNLYVAADAEAVKSAANQRLIDMISETVHKAVAAGVLTCDRPELVVGTLYHGLCGSANDAIRSKHPPKNDVLINNAGRLARATFAKSYRD